MATATSADFQVYQSETQSLFNELLTQNARAFGDASRGAIMIGTEQLRGEYAKEAFFKTVANLVTRRNPTATTTGTATKLEQGEHVGVKLYRRIQNEALGQAFRTIGYSPSVMAELVAEQAAQAVTLNRLNDCIRAARAAITGNANTTHDVTGTVDDVITHQNLLRALRLFGDQAESEIVCWVMHSGSFYDIKDFEVGSALLEVTAATIYGGGPGTLGKPVLVTDSDALIAGTAPDNDHYVVLGLTRMSVEAIESEGSDLLIERVGGNENITYRYQWEGAHTVKVKGYAWDTDNGGANPADGTLATTSNWDKVVTSDKSTAGVALIHDRLGAAAS